MSHCICEFVKAKSRIHADKYVPSRVCPFALQIYNTKGQVLAHNIECCMVYLIPSKNTIRSCVVLAHGIGKS